MSRGRRKYDNDEASGSYCYSNSFSIGYNGYVFIFEFGMTDAKGQSHLRSRVVMNPAHAEQFSTMLNNAVDQHVCKYGAIKTELQTGSSYSAESCAAALQRTDSSGDDKQAAPAAGQFPGMEVVTQ